MATQHAFAGSSTSGNTRVTGTLPKEHTTCYSIVRPEMNQIFCLQLALGWIRLYCFVARMKKTGVPVC